jgi:hypothetical protein
MKIFFGLVLAAIILASILVVYNVFRCIKAPGDACSSWCLVKKVPCPSSDCDNNNKFVCRAPDFIDYVDLASHWWEDQTVRFKK